jgi:hypothetical protein
MMKNNEKTRFLCLGVAPKNMLYGDNALVYSVGLWWWLLNIAGAYYATIGAYFALRLPQLSRELYSQWVFLHSSSVASKINIQIGGRK